MNVFGSIYRLAYLIDPRLVIIQASISDIVFGSASTGKKGVHFQMKSPKSLPENGKWHPDFGFNMSWEASCMVTSRKQSSTVVVVQK